LSEGNSVKEITEGGLLDGKIRYRQFSTGHRSGFEPVLLAASIATRPGERVLEAGCGAGAALLCLGHRVSGIAGLGVEIDPEMADLASENFRINSLNDVSCVCSAVEQLQPTGDFEHVMANPPWHGGDSTHSPDRLRALAHHAKPSLLSNWVASLARCLKPRGTMTLILPGAGLSEAAAAMRAEGFGAVTLFPLWPRVGRPAKLMIIAASLGGRGPDRVLPGLVLHDEAGITEAAQAVLRDGKTIELNGYRA
jgi:tRNA1Val (adenine37-N6)-methyltransferase